MKDSQIVVSIIFPSYNGEDVIRNCLNSIVKLNGLNQIELIIVDNNSQDNTKEIIKAFKTINIHLISNSENIGFAKACNIAVTKAKGEFIFITNQDISFPRDFFTILLDLYDRIKKIREVIISPTIVFPGKYVNYYGAKVHFLGFSYTPQMYQKLPKTHYTFKTLKASGCSMFMKKKVFIDLNGFDPFFFMYHEDTDFSLRAIRSGISIYTTNETYLHHQKLHFLLNSFTYYHIERNRYILLYKNINSIKKLAPFFIISEIILLFQALLTKKIKSRFRIYKFLLQNYVEIKHLRYNKFNEMYQRLKKKDLDKHLDPIVLGRILSNVRILRIFLKIINLIL